MKESKNLSQYKKKDFNNEKINQNLLVFYTCVQQHFKNLSNTFLKNKNHI